MRKHGVERLRRSMAMAPPDIPAPLTCRQLLDLLTQPQKAGMSACAPTCGPMMMAMSDVRVRFAWQAPERCQTLSGWCS
jgi:hypothetical protein